MEILVEDTLTAMADLLEQPLERRPDAVREIMAPTRSSIPMPGDIVDIHHNGGGFRPTPTTRATCPPCGG